MTLWTAVDNTHHAAPIATVNTDNEVGPAPPASGPAPGQTYKEVQRAER